MNHIYSTLSAPVAYSYYAKGGGDLPKRYKKIIIKGGARVADKNLVTPLGVVTQVTDEDLKFLKENPVFQLHVKNGYIKIDSKKEIEAVISDMNTRDESAPIVPQDYINAPDNVAVPKEIGKTKTKSKQ